MRPGQPVEGVWVRSCAAKPTRGPLCFERGGDGRRAMHLVDAVVATAFCLGVLAIVVYVSKVCQAARWPTYVYVLGMCQCLGMVYQITGVLPVVLRVGGLFLAG